MRHGSRVSREGQSEVIAAMILIPLLIVIFSAVTTNMLKTNVVGTSSLANRARFEQERASESLRAVWISDMNGVCKVYNTGSVDIEIVRIWRNGNSNPVNVIVKKGEEVTGLDVSNVELAVTSRGSLFPLKTMCEQSQLGIPGPAGPPGPPGQSESPFSPENILNASKLIGKDFSNKRIITRISEVQSAAVIYWNGSRWFFNSGNGWVIDINNTMNIRPEVMNPDLDKNKISEVTTVKVSGGTLYQVDLSAKGDYNINITFVDLLNVRENPSVITIYFKLVADVGSSPSQQISVGSAAILSSGGRSAFATGSTAMAAYKATGLTTAVLVVTGNVVFPVQAYEPYRNSIQPGIYNLTLSFSVNLASSNPTFKNIRIEYVAVTGAELRWLP